MGVLGNARHERFAQAVANGSSADEAYVVAGYSANVGNAGRLNRNELIRSRVEEILSVAAEKVAIDKSKVLEELGKIAFSDLRKAVEWHGTLVQEQDNPDGGDVLVIKNIFSNHVRLIDSADLDDATAAAISEVRQSPTGGLSIKLHSKDRALELIGRHLGMFKERVEVTGKDGGPIAIEDVSARELIESRISGLATRGPAEGNPGKPH